MKSSDAVSSQSTWRHGGGAFSPPLARPPSTQQQRFPEKRRLPSFFVLTPPSDSPLMQRTPPLPPPPLSRGPLFSTFHTLDFFVPLFGFSHRCRPAADADGRTDGRTGGNHAASCIIHAVPPRCRCPRGAPMVVCVRRVSMLVCLSPTDASESIDTQQF